MANDQVHQLKKTSKCVSKRLGRERSIHSVNIFQGDDPEVPQQGSNKEDTNGKGKKKETRQQVVKKKKKEKEKKEATKEKKESPQKRRQSAKEGKKPPKITLENIFPI